MNKNDVSKSVSRRGFVAGTTSLAGTLAAPAVLRAQPAAIKVGLSKPHIDLAALRPV